MGDEDAELKDVLIRSLNENGILPKIQAQLRAAVYVALENHNFNDFVKPSNETLRSFMRNDDGLLVASLVVDFLSKMKLDSTLEVLKIEAELDENTLMNSENIASELFSTTRDKDRPLLAQFVPQYRLTVSQSSGSRSRTDCQSFSQIPVYKHNISGRPSKSNKKQDMSNGTVANGLDDRKPSATSVGDEKTQQPRRASNLSSASSGSGASIPNRQNGSLSTAGGDCDGDDEIIGTASQCTISLTRGDGFQRTPGQSVSDQAPGSRAKSAASQGELDSGGCDRAPLRYAMHDLPTSMAVGSAKESQSNAYQEDFDSHQSSASLDSHTVTPTATTASSLHLQLNSEDGHSPTHPRDSSPRDRASETPPAGDANPQSVIRVYLQTSPRRSRPGQENSSDIDEDIIEDVDGECVSLSLVSTQQDASTGASGAASGRDRGERPEAGSGKLLLVADADEVTVDQTVNSDDSLSLDHAEDVLPPTTAAGRARR